MPHIATIATQAPGGRYDGTEWVTPLRLLNMGIAVCSNCGNAQPNEVATCGGCGDTMMVITEVAKDSIRKLRDRLQMQYGTRWMVEIQLHLFKHGTLVTTDAVLKAFSRNSTGQWRRQILTAGNEASAKAPIQRKPIYHADQVHTGN